MRICDSFSRSRSTSRRNRSRSPPASALPRSFSWSIFSKVARLRSRDLRAAVASSKFFGGDAHISTAKGRWYLCNFEVKKTMHGYELIMPVPDSIELLCQKCLGVTISEPIKNGMEGLYVCQDCFSPEEE